MTNDGANSRKVSSSKAFLTFFKSLFGAGLLSLPNVLGKVGLPLGIILYTLVASGCTVTCFMLVEARDVTERFLLLPQQQRQSYQKQQGENNDKEACIEKSKEGTKQKNHYHLVTYGDLASILLGPRMASLTRWIIIVLNFLFSAGLVIVICENIVPILFRTSSSRLYTEEEEMDHRRTLGYILFPIISVALQIPWLQDMWIISALGLLVYTVGVMGSTIYSSFLTITSASSLSMTPTDLWQWKWNGIPSFLGSAVYAMEGINLTLPTVHSMEDKSKSAHVICSALLTYGAVTLSFASVGYAGGLGGGPGTMRTKGECDVVTNCIIPEELQIVMQIALSLALLLSIPVMMYPTTEMLEVMLTDYYSQQSSQHREQKNIRQQEQQHIQYGSVDSTLEERQHFKHSEISMSNVDSNDDFDMISNKTFKHTDNIVKEKPHSVITNSIILDCSTDNGSNNDCNDIEPYSQEKSWKLRLLLSFFITLLGCSTKSFTLFSSFVGAVGLTFAGFILPPLLYYQSMIKANINIHWYMRLLMGMLVGFGLWNMTIGGVSSFLDLIHGL
uniref:Amino acid transporter transmembrane domain-containing protein n=1 Tax=Ditylum brightwellii TaxID=49249 RepID=A0A7S4QKV0_9STRA|mmetsp:Transcript_21197/g.27899  ORF Transcript_21197/g.27899 Transcript_21197/m.27899 type:complete len:559 (+) Transcript_21197:196-1872(+)